MLRLGKLVPARTMLLLCDMQERFRNRVIYFPEIVQTSARLLQAARLLGVRAVVTEQYPDGLGPTVSELGATDLPTFPKTSLSMVMPEVLALLETLPAPRSVVLCGIEAQACVMATALDLLERGVDVHLIADACSARSQVDRLIAFERMKQSGVFITTSECIILQLLCDAKHPKFREVQKLLAPPVPDTGLLGMFGGAPIAEKR
ncbi:isochorismatase domain-containing protein 2 [Petromyzon marinus]|nr:isochorismatase domain-containing protein 2 [Petromyzon marinus]